MNVYRGDDGRWYERVRASGRTHVRVVNAVATRCGATPGRMRRVAHDAVVTCPVCAATH